MLVLLFGIDSTDVTVFVIHEWREPCDAIFFNAKRNPQKVFNIIPVDGFRVKNQGYRVKVSVIREWREPCDPDYFNRRYSFRFREWREPCDPIFLMRSATHRRWITLFLLMVFGFKIKGTGWRFPSFANDENLVTPIASSEMQPIVHEGVFRVFNLPALTGVTPGWLPQMQEKHLSEAR